MIYSTEKWRPLNLIGLECRRSTACWACSVSLNPKHEVYFPRKVTTPFILEVSSLQYGRYLGYLASLKKLRKNMQYYYCICLVCYLSDTFPRNYEDLGHSRARGVDSQLLHLVRTRLLKLNDWWLHGMRKIGQYMCCGTLNIDMCGAEQKHFVVWTIYGTVNNDDTIGTVLCVVMCLRCSDVSVLGILSAGRCTLRSSFWENVVTHYPPSAHNGNNWERKREKERESRVGGEGGGGRGGKDRERPGREGDREREMNIIYTEGENAQC